MRAAVLLALDDDRRARARGAHRVALQPRRAPDRGRAHRDPERRAREPRPCFSPAPAPPPHARARAEQISTDVSRIDAAAQWFHAGWTAPVQVSICLIILCVQLGPSALAGFALFVLMLPIQERIMKGQFVTRRGSMQYTDRRAKLLMEILGARRWRFRRGGGADVRAASMRIVKYFTYEQPFLRRAWLTLPLRVGRADAAQASSTSGTRSSRASARSKRCARPSTMARSCRRACTVDMGCPQPRARVLDPDPRRDRRVRDVLRELARLRRRDHLLLAQPVQRAPPPAPLPASRSPATARSSCASR
jgi:hypothetical protein